MAALNAKPAGTPIIPAFKPPADQPDYTPSVPFDRLKVFAAEPCSLRCPRSSRPGLLRSPGYRRGRHPDEERPDPPERLPGGSWDAPERLQARPSRRRIWRDFGRRHRPQAPIFRWIALRFRPSPSQPRSRKAGTCEGRIGMSGAFRALERIVTFRSSCPVPGRSGGRPTHHRPKAAAGACERLRQAPVLPRAGERQGHARRSLL